MSLQIPLHVELHQKAIKYLSSLTNRYMKVSEFQLWKVWLLGNSLRIKALYHRWYIPIYIGFKNWYFFIFYVNRLQLKLKTEKIPTHYIYPFWYSKKLQSCLQRNHAKLISLWSTVHPFQEFWEFKNSKSEQHLHGQASYCTIIYFYGKYYTNFSILVGILNVNSFPF